MGIHSSGKEAPMKNGLWLIVLLSCLIAPRFVVAGDAPVVVDVPPYLPAPLDVVTLKDGGVLYGEVIEMSGGVLLIKTAAAADNIVKINWASVSKLAINHPIPIHLKEGTVLIGTATEGPDGTMKVRAEPLKGTMEVPID